MRAAAAALLVVIALLAAGGGFLLGHSWSIAESGPAPLDTQAAPAAFKPGAKRPSFSLPDLEGRLRNVAEWDGRLLVVNFWATWCAPCREEIPLFVRLQEQFGDRGLQFVGIALDQPANVAPFAAEYGINYPVLVGQGEAIELMRRFGSLYGALPFTAVVGRDGRVAYVHEGVFLPSQAKTQIIDRL